MSVSSAPPTIQGFVSFSIGGSIFDLPPHYQPIQAIGHGAYGVVCSAIHTPTNTKVAIKKITNIFANLQDTKRILREIKLLRHFNHENVMTIADLFITGSRDTFNDIYLVSELMDTDLHQIINSQQILTDEHCQYFLYQMLRGLKYVHSASVLHRDLKPSNLLINEDCLLKIADFGLARVHDGKLGEMTEYVATRWYRAPEIILSWKHYTHAIDIWSVGCIFAEMMFRKPLFQGSDYIHQIISITDILGTPSLEDINALGKEQARQFLIKLGFKPRVPWYKLIPTGSPLAFDLLDRMLTFNPLRRCSVEDALSHPYLASIRDAEDEPIADTAFDFDFEKWHLTKEVYRELIFQEVLAFHPEIPESAPVPQVTPMNMDDQDQDQDQDTSLKMTNSATSTPVQFLGMVSPGSGMISLEDSSMFFKSNYL